jgi:hypothetical protein
MRYAILLLFLIPMFSFCVSQPATSGVDDDGVVFEHTMCPHRIRYDPAVAPDVVHRSIGKQVGSSSPVVW